MKLSDILLLSIRSFRTKPVRTFLTALGVSVGIGTVLFLVSLGYGLQNIILNKITTADALLSLDVTPGTSEFIVIDDDSIKYISEIEEVVEISPAINLSAQSSINEITSDGMVYAVSSSYFRLGGITSDMGDGFSSDDSYEAIISSAGAQLFNMNPEEIIGKEMSLSLFLPKLSDAGFEEIEMDKREEKYKIVGLMNNDNSNFIYIPINTINDLNINDYAQLKVKVSDNAFMENVREKIIEQGFLVSSLSDTIDQANKIFRIIQIILALFGVVALIVSAIGMINTMTISLLERINEIGIMRAIGASKTDISILFLIESSLMGLLGGVGGIAIGYLAGVIVNFGVNILANNLGGQSLDLFYQPPWFIGAIIVSSVAIGFLTGVYPSRRASKINPLDALRYK